MLKRYKTFQPKPNTIDELKKVLQTIWDDLPQNSINKAILSFTIRYDTRCYFNVRSKADISQLNLPHGTDN